jgi:hypothetical protein
VRFALIARRSTPTNDALSAVVVDDARWGVDLLPGQTGCTVLEVNGAVEFTGEYGFLGDVFAETAAALMRCVRGAAFGARALAAV